MYIKIKSYGGTGDGNAILWITAHDVKGNTIQLDYTNVVEHNYTSRTLEGNFNAMFSGRNIEPYAPYNDVSKSIGCYMIMEVPDTVSELKVSSYSVASHLNTNIDISVSSIGLEYYYSDSKIISSVNQVLSLKVRSLFFSLIKSNNKVYSLKSDEVLYETKMTSNTTPTPYVASASSVYASTAIFEPFMAFNGTFDGANDCWASANNSPTGWIQIDYGTKKIVNRVRVSSRHVPSQTTAPKDFYILASNDGINFTSLLEVKNQTSWVALGTKIFDFENTSPFRYYRIKIISNNGGTYTNIGDILFSYLPKLSVTQIPSSTIDNFINYGIPSIEDFNLIYSRKKYILQDKVSKDTDGLWKQELNRKPLSIKFE